MSDERECICGWTIHLSERKDDQGRPLWEDKGGSNACPEGGGHSPLMEVNMLDAESLGQEGAE